MRGGGGSIGIGSRQRPQRQRFLSRWKPLGLVTITALLVLLPSLLFHFAPPSLPSPAHSNTTLTTAPSSAAHLSSISPSAAPLDLNPLSSPPNYSAPRRHPLFYEARADLVSKLTEACGAPPVPGTANLEKCERCAEYTRGLWFDEAAEAEAGAEAGGCRNSTDLDNPRIVWFHAYWAGKMRAVPWLSVKSFLCTQKNACYRLTIWTMSLLEKPEKFLTESILVQGVNSYEIHGTGGEDTEIHILAGRVIFRQLKKELFDDGGYDSSYPEDIKSASEPGFSDLARFMILRRYGGIYFDLDVFFLRSLTPLLEMPIDWGYRWSNTKQLNTAVLRIRKGSELMSHFFKENSFDPRDISESCPASDFCKNNFVQLPCSWFDPIWTTIDGLCNASSTQGFPIWMSKFSEFMLKPAPQEILDAMNETMFLPPELRKPLAVGQSPPVYQRLFPGVFAYHWHNGYKHKIVRDSLADILGNEMNECNSFVEPPPTQQNPSKRRKRKDRLVKWAH